MLNNSLVMFIWSLIEFRFFYIQIINLSNIPRVVVHGYTLENHTSRLELASVRIRYSRHCRWSCERKIPIQLQFFRPVCGDELSF